jgi:6-phosphogluconate dehydrogenase
MELGMVGLGRMGVGIAARLQAAGHHCVVFDLDDRAVAAATDHGATGASSPGDLADRLAPPRAVWLMVPAAVTARVIEEYAAVLEPGDALIDGGNSFYRDSIARAAMLADRGIDFVDVGTSGGVWGRERGYCLMVGGPDRTFARLEPLFRAVAPGIDARPRTPGRTGPAAPAEHGYLHCGPAGAGHFVKMVHNGIEYGLMAAYAEGLNLLHHADAGNREQIEDAETAPLRNPEAFRYRFDLPAVAEVWRRGSVISSWLLDLVASALAASPALDDFGGRVSDSGEGRWTVEAAIDVGVPVPVIASALFDRFSSRGDAEFAGRVLSALRKQFGGHEERDL